MSTPSACATPAPNPLSAIQKRAQRPDLVSTWSIRALLPRLPLLFPVEPNLPPSPKTRYRSQYHYRGPEVLLDEARRATLSDLEIALYLVDFAPLAPLLAQIYVPSVKGQVPFHPVSMFLCICLRRELNLAWRPLARLLASDNGAGWRTLFGFSEGQTPSASGLRHFFHTVGPERFDELCPRFIALLRRHGLLAEHSTEGGWFGFGRRTYNAMDTYTPYAQIPASVRTQIESILREEGQPATPGNVERMYERRRREDMR